MISLDNYVKAFIDVNWLTVGIILILMKGIATQFNVRILKKIFLIITGALSFIRPSTKEVQEQLDDRHDEKKVDKPG